MGRLWRHLRALWPGWGIAAPLPFVVYLIWRIVWCRHLRWDEVAATGLALTLFAVGPRTKRVFIGLYPVGLVGFFYSSMGAIENLGLSTSRVHVCDMRRIEAEWFGLTLDGRRETVHDWLQAHSTPALDILCAVPYATFAIACF